MPLTALIKQRNRIGIVLLISLLYLFAINATASAQSADPSASGAQTGVVTSNSSATAGSGSAVTLTVTTAPGAPQSTQEESVFGAVSPTTWDWWLRMLSAVVISALGAWAIYKVIQYVTQMQNKYYDTTERLAARGQSVRTVVINATVPVAAAGLQAGAMDVNQPADSAPPTVKFKVTGPHALTIGVESADFTAVLITDGIETPADDTVSWKVVPEGAAVLTKTQGSPIRLTPQQLGAFDLVVSATGAVTDGGATELHFPVAVAAPASNGISLPFIGEGWGTLILAVLFGVIIALLGLSRVLSTSLVGTLLGALLGYLFGVAAPSIGGGSSKPGNNNNRPPTQ